MKGQGRKQGEQTAKERSEDIQTLDTGLGVTGQQRPRNEVTKNWKENKD